MERTKGKGGARGRGHGRIQSGEPVTLERKKNGGIDRKHYPTGPSSLAKRDQKAHFVKSIKRLRQWWEVNIGVTSTLPPPPLDVLPFSHLIWRRRRHGGRLLSLIGRMTSTA